MITWLQNATAKQHRLIFGSLLLVIVVSFVFFPVVQSMGGGQATTSVYQGVDLNDPTVRARFRDATFFAQMTGQRMNENGLVQRVSQRNAYFTGIGLVQDVVPAPVQAK